MEISPFRTYVCSHEVGVGGQTEASLDDQKVEGAERGQINILMHFLPMCKLPSNTLHIVNTQLLLLPPAPFFASTCFKVISLLE